jgi:hypothetical protein
LSTLGTHRDTELRLERFSTIASDVGPENPMPPLDRIRPCRVDPYDRAYMKKHHGLRAGYGRGGTLLPYRMQDGYSRAVAPRTFTAIVLENNFLKATFLPELGGRLWSLVDKPAKRELLDANPVIHMANLGYRDAWFSGGVEWNICQMGYHTPLTASTLFTGLTQLDDGTPVLRFWEYERRLGVVYQIDAWLPAGSAFLRVRPSIHNSQTHTVPIYQWSNIAVDETPDTRVIVPATKAFVNTYSKRGMRTDLESIPVYNGTDITYPTNSESARDYFFDIQRRRAFVTALRGDGRGLIQTSTSRQVGRKLFVWGFCPGGRRWQEYLSEPGHNYIEIQAGLGKTQLESLPMPAHATWDWVEAYGLMEANPAITHGDNWNAASSHVDERLAAALPAAQLEHELTETRSMAARPPAQTLLQGSGWGALERLRSEREHDGMSWPSGAVFEASTIGDDQAPWHQLLENGRLPARKPADEPGSFQSSPAWKQLLERSIRRGGSDHWLGRFHLGLMRYSAGGATRGAALAWEASVRKKANPWALRCLARLAHREHDLVRAAALYRRAHRALPSNPTLAAEAASSMRLAGRVRETLALIAALPRSLQQHDCVRMAKAWASLDVGDYRTTLKILNGPEFGSIREGEIALSTLWFRAHDLLIAEREGLPVTRELRLRVRQQFPVPPRMDMRMQIQTAEEETNNDMRRDEHVARLRKQAADLARKRRAR